MRRIMPNKRNAKQWALLLFTLLNSTTLLKIFAAHRDYEESNVATLLQMTNNMNQLLVPILPETTQLPPEMREWEAMIQRQVESSESSTDTQESTNSQSEQQTFEATTGEATTAEPTTAEATTSQSTTQQATTAQATSEQPTTAEATTGQATTAQATSSQPTTGQATTSQPTTRQATTAQATSSQPTTGQATTSQPTTRQATTAQATTRIPTTAAATTRGATTAVITTLQATTRALTTAVATTRQATTGAVTTLRATTRQLTTALLTTLQATTRQATTRSATTGDATTGEATTSQVTTELSTTAKILTTLETSLITPPITIIPPPSELETIPAQLSSPKNKPANTLYYIMGAIGGLIAVSMSTVAVAIGIYRRKQSTNNAPLQIIPQPSSRELIAFQATVADERSVIFDSLRAEAQKNALHDAIRDSRSTVSNRVMLIKKYLDAGETIDGKDEAGINALQLAITQPIPNYEIISTLLNHPSSSPYIVYRSLFNITLTISIYIIRRFDSLTEQYPSNKVNLNKIKVNLLKHCEAALKYKDKYPSHLGALLNQPHWVSKGFASVTLDDVTGATPLQLAIDFRSLAAAEQYLELLKSCSPYAQVEAMYLKDKSHRSVFSKFSELSDEIDIESEFIDILKPFCKAALRYEKDFPVHHAILIEDYPTFLKLLEEERSIESKLNVQDNLEKYTPLDIATMKGASVKNFFLYLVKFQKSPSSARSTMVRQAALPKQDTLVFYAKNYPLHLAIINSETDNVIRLLNNKSPVSITNSEGHNVLDMLIFYPNPFLAEFVLRLARPEDLWKAFTKPLEDGLSCIEIINSTIMKKAYSEEELKIVVLLQDKFAELDQVHQMHSKTMTRSLSSEVINPLSKLFLRTEDGYHSDSEPPSLKGTVRIKSDGLNEDSSIEEKKTWRATVRIG